MQEDFPKLKSHEIKTFDDMEKRGIIGGIKVPSFIKKEFIRDSQFRRPDDPDYDPSTLHIDDK